MKKLMKNYGLIVFFFCFIIGKETIINQQLKQINNCYSASQYEDLQTNYNELMKELEIPFVVNSEYLYGKILLHDPFGYEKNIMIVTNEKAEEKNAVMNQFGLIGSVISRIGNTAKVQLLTHKDTTLSVKINHSYGVLKWQDQKLIVDSVVLKESISPGDIVYTSGLTNIPGEIKVGKVIGEISNDSLEKKYEIELMTNELASSLIYVLKNKGDI